VALSGISGVGWDNKGRNGMARRGWDGCDGQTHAC